MLYLLKRAFIRPSIYVCAWRDEDAIDFYHGKTVQIDQSEMFDSIRLVNPSKSPAPIFQGTIWERYLQTQAPDNVTSEGYFRVFSMCPVYKVLIIGWVYRESRLHRSMAQALSPHQASLQGPQHGRSADGLAWTPLAYNRQNVMISISVA